ncbi:MAG: hypothetical protein IPN90_04025 [Elusimicrobia bacterium]|nr:hypothetical protein [Elusimicrobiota bacterium]
MIAVLPLLFPELLLTAAAVLLLLVDDGRQERRGFSLAVTVSALVGASLLALTSREGTAFNMLTLDATARFLKVLLGGAVLMVLALSSGFSGFSGNQEKPFHWGTFSALLLLCRRWVCFS